MSRVTQLSCINKIESSWEEFLSWVSFNHSIHPIDPIAPEHSEFVFINSKIKIRCIHINPDQLRKSRVLDLIKDQVKTSKNKRNSITEEYWFTKWSKPLRCGKCYCSFRKSHRLSQISAQDINIIDKPPCLREQFQHESSHRTLENFVERLIQDAIFEAVQELYLVESEKNEKLGLVNFAFESNEDVICSKSFINGEPDAYKMIKHNENSTNTGQFSQRTDSKISAANSAEFVRCRHKDKESKKPLVILYHGIGTSSDIWWQVIKSLVSKGHEIVAPDMLGHGFSSAPDKEKSYEFNNLLLHALAIFDNYVSLDESRKCVLIGHSYGCSLATAVYHHRVQKVCQLILISGGGPTPLAPPVEHDELINSEFIQALIQPLIFCGMNRSLFYSSRGKFFDVCEEVGGIPHHILQFVKMGQNWPEGDATFHRRIIVPTLLVHGLQDKKITLVQECEMERTIPRSFLELIPNAGHMSMLEAPEQLTHMILCFLDYWS